MNYCKSAKNGRLESTGLSTVWTALSLSSNRITYLADEALRP